MHQDPRLAGAGAGQHQHVGLLPPVSDDALLDGILSASTMDRHDSGVVWRVISLARSGSQRRKKSCCFRLK